MVPSFPSDLVMGFGGHWHFKIFTKLFNNMGSALSATSGCGTHFWLHVIHAGRLGSECSLRLWFSFLSTTPQDLSADCSVVLISCDPDLCTPSVVIRISVCVKPTWVVRDLSAASAVVLISLHDSASSECGPVPWFSLLAIQLSTTGGSSTHRCLR